MDSDRTVGVELFSRNNTQRYIKAKDANGEDVYIRNNLNDQKYESYYRLGNISINPKAAQNLALIPLSTKTDKEDLARANELIDTWDVRFGTFNIEEYSKATFNSYYNNFVGKFATWGDILDSYVNNQQNMVTGYDNQRTETMGVSSDEELQKMIKYQHAYNASSRYVNVVSEMLEHLVTSLGA
jgi:flagellar hook-associated protein 1 FlgK